METQCAFLPTFCSKGRGCTISFLSVIVFLRTVALSQMTLTSPSAFIESSLTFTDFRSTFTETLPEHLQTSFTTISLATKLQQFSSSEFLATEAGSSRDRVADGSVKLETSEFVWSSFVAYPTSVGATINNVGESISSHVLRLSANIGTSGIISDINLPPLSTLETTVFLDSVAISKRWEPVDFFTFSTPVTHLPLSTVSLQPSSVSALLSSSDLYYDTTGASVLDEFASTYSGATPLNRSSRDTGVSESSNSGTLVLENSSRNADVLENNRSIAVLESLGTSTLVLESSYWETHAGSFSGTPVLENSKGTLAPEASQTWIIPETATDIQASPSYLDLTVESTIVSVPSPVPTIPVTVPMLTTSAMFTNNSTLPSGGSNAEGREATSPMVWDSSTTPGGNASCLDKDLGCTEFRGDEDEGTDLKVKVIVGVTCGAVVLFIIAGLVFGCLKRQRGKMSSGSKVDLSSYWDDSVTLSYINGHIDIPRDSTDEMISLDNDSFLNSLDSMSFTNTWNSDSAKHTNF